ncbi:MAG: hypothetical protein ACI4BC_00385 [Muribaculaceae bacterium]
MNKIVLLTAMLGFVPGIALFADSSVEQVNVVSNLVFDEDGEVVIADSVKYDGRNCEELLANAMMFVIDNLNVEEEEYPVLDHKNFSFYINSRYELKTGKNNLIDKLNEVTYKYTLTIMATNQSVSYKVSNIEASFKERGIIPKKMSITKLYASPKKQHKELVDKFFDINKVFLNRLIEYIRDTRLEPVAHWEEVANGDVVAGMNKTEVKLSIGVPEIERIMGDGEKWMYSNDYVVLFKDGSVVRVIK